MTITFPQDSALPQLQKLVDFVEMTRIIEEALDLEVVKITPRYVRYKPETSCIIQYDFTYRSAGTEVATQGAHIKVYADHRAEAKATGGRADRLEKRLENIDPDVPKVTYLPEVDGALQIYPADLDLRPLARAADIKSAGKEIKKALGLPSSPKLAAEPELVRYKPGRKALLRYHVPTISDLPLYGKVFEDQSVEEMREITGKLIEAGLPTARVLGIVADHNFIVHETVPGIALNELRHSPEYLQWIDPLAEKLWQLQGIELPQLPDHCLADELSTLQDVQKQLSTLLPDLESRLGTLVQTIERGFAEVDDVVVTSHGDFYDDQAIVGDEGLGLIDLEAMRRSHPLLDVGNMLAHFTAATRNEGDNVASAHEQFRNLALDHFEEEETTLRLFEAACLLKLAPGPFRRLEEKWEEGVERLVSLAERTLASARIDEALPQLEEILDVSAMQRHFAQNLGSDLAGLETVDLIRHKPGRRAILRFTLEDSSTLYGKTFASKRGPKVFDVTQSIADAQAFGPDVLTPVAVAYLPDQKLVLLGEIEGEPMEKRLISGDTEIAERIAFALYHLHSSNVDLKRYHDLEKELSPLPGRADEVGEHAPELRADAAQLLQSITFFDHSDLCWRFHPIHRDMYHDQVLVTKAQLAVLDLDDAAMSEPTIDVANFATHLLLLGLQREGDPEAFGSVVGAFLNQYAELDADLDQRLLNFLIAATALRLAGIHVSRENGTEVARGMLSIGHHHFRMAQSAMAR